MSVKIMFIGRLGNNLFQYALGRIIAERHGWALSCRPYPLAAFIPYGALGMTTSLDHGTAGANLISAAPYFPNAPLRIEGQAASAPQQNFQLDVDGWTGQKIDLDAILADPTPRQIRLAGYFQRQEYYVPRRREIRRWFQLETDFDVPAVGDDDVLLNIRGGKEFEQLGWRISTDYYMKAIDVMTRIGQIYVCGVGIDEQVRQTLAPLRPIYFDAPPLAHLKFIQRFRRMVLPNSTFSWWAGFLSWADEIYVPAPDNCSGYSFNSGDVDLDMRDPSYRPISCSFA